MTCSVKYLQTWYSGALSHYKGTHNISHLSRAGGPLLWLKAKQNIKLGQFSSAGEGIWAEGGEYSN